MFHDHELTRHADMRLRQRGLRDADLRLLLTAASQVSPDAYLLTEQDAVREIAQRKQEIQCLERLKGCKVVVVGGTIITCYRAGRENQKKTLRHGRATQ